MRAYVSHLDERVTNSRPPRVGDLRYIHVKTETYPVGFYIAVEVLEVVTRADGKVIYDVVPLTSSTTLYVTGYDLLEEVDPITVNHAPTAPARKP